MMYNISQMEGNRNRIERAVSIQPALQSIS